jgi:uncharacterized protein
LKKLLYFNELDKRKETVLKTMMGLGKLTRSLKKELKILSTLPYWKIYYLPYKPKRKTRATTAIEKDLNRSPP